MKKIAFPTNDKVNVEEHFGHCKYFALCSIDDNKEEKINFVEAPEHAPGKLPKFLGEQKADVIITGGMGSMAVQMFSDQNIEVIMGARGAIQEVLKKYLNNELSSTVSACTEHKRGCH